MHTKDLHWSISNLTATFINIINIGGLVDIRCFFVSTILSDRQSVRPGKA